MYLSLYGEDKGSPKLRVHNVNTVELERDAKTGEPRRRTRTVQKTESLLDRLLRQGNITVEQYEAGLRFEQNFMTVFSGQISGSTAFERTSRSSAPIEPSDALLHAKKRIYEDIELAGGSSSLEGSVLWYTVGFGETLRAWSMRRNVPRSHATGHLMEALRNITKTA